MPAPEDLVKAFSLLPKRPDITDERFHRHWRDPHGVLALRLRVLRGYVQSHRIPDPVAGWSPGPYEGFPEMWLDDVSTALGLGDDPDYLEHLAEDEHAFVDRANVAFLVTRQDVAAAGEPGGFKVLQFVRRVGGRESFAEAWGADGAERELAGRLGVVRHVRCRVVDEQHDAGRPAFDAVREVWWPDRPAFERGVTADPGAWAGLMAGPGVDEGRSIAVPVEEVRFR